MEGDAASGTRSPWQQPLPPAGADVAVVGGGVIGAATAYALARLEPAARVVLVEAGHLARGASGRNAGFLLLGTHADYASAVDAYGREAARRVWRFTQENLALVQALAERVGPEALGLERRGSVLAAGSDDEAARLRRAHALLTEDGVAAAWWDAPEAGEKTGLEAYAGALFVPEGGALDPVRLVRALAWQSTALVLEGAAAADLRPASGGGTEIVLEGGHRLRAQRLVLALNAYLPRLVPSLAGVVRPVRAQMLATEALPKVHLRAPVYSHEGYFYLRQRADGRLLLGGARHLHADEEVGYDDATTPALQADLEAYLARHVPAAAGVPVARRWSGVMGFSPDGLPVLGEVPGLPEAVFAAGFTGHGMGYGVRFGFLVARRVLGHSDDASDLFDAARLEARVRS
ncbi:MAG: NAD(P)/FAD-dependent oxidoreductase [Rubricoccaceae bacterium]